jgi:hypothetical protein
MPLPGSGSTQTGDRYARAQNRELDGTDVSRPANVGDVEFTTPTVSSAG